MSMLLDGVFKIAEMPRVHAFSMTANGTTSTLDLDLELTGLPRTWHLARARRIVTTLGWGTTRETPGNPPVWASRARFQKTT